MNKINKEITFGPVKLAVPINVFENVAEATKQAGDESRVLAAINDNALPVASAQSLIVKVVQDLTKVPFIQIKKKNADGTITASRDFSKDGNSNYVQRALKLMPAVTVAMVQDVLNTRSTLACDLAPKLARSVQLSKYYLSAAEALLSGEADLPKFQSLFANAGLGTFTATGNKEQDLDRLGRLCEALEKKQSPLAAIKKK